MGEIAVSQIPLPIIARVLVHPKYPQIYSSFANLKKKTSLDVNDQYSRNYIFLFFSLSLKHKLDFISGDDSHLPVSSLLFSSLFLFLSLPSTLLFQVFSKTFLGNYARWKYTSKSRNIPDCTIRRSKSRSHRRRQSLRPKQFISIAFEGDSKILHRKSRTGRIVCHIHVSFLCNGHGDL
jgi:hypothetical protein